ncbi:MULTISPECIES: RidA family protein [Paenibacillus]|uniref:RidA family protein n=3 Tax=Paenibacillus TaxID=44249 RepID=A0ABU3RPJ4_9BACL|nr:MULTISPECIES: RidA family protein [Paenibacillus]MBP1967325.1 enamine deaminase RidA (YjgF/YER057c/UK114 family) [Paenibacillus aceris]MCY9657441.1 RidA family protein [Paenibacillus anseongense]MDU0206231.1 RidA family protein [Paenibacillus sp. PFR10]MEB4799065.1 RidA family protein [Paenibacillus chondroitinus]MEC0266984.1 RidA family protein [Paenibacillus anseongense]
MSNIEQRLQELGITLPPSPEPRFTYIPCNQTGNLIYLSGQDCRINGELMYEGKLGREVTIEQGQAAARQTIINCLAVMKGYLGDLDRVVKIVKMLAFVNSAPGFGDQPYVINGASDLLVAVFGEKGKHARSAIGTSDLPFHTPVEIELIVEVRD